MHRYESSKLNSRKKADNLIADKELFRLWFEFYKLSLASTDKRIKSALRKSTAFYKSWGADAGIHFDDWWVAHKHLFVDSDRVRIAEHDPNTDAVLIRVPVGKAESVLVREFRELLVSEPARFKISNRKIPKAHQYAPSEVQGVKREALRMMLALQQHVFCDQTLKGRDLLNRVKEFFERERYKRKRNFVPPTFAWDPKPLKSDHYEEAMRSVRRYRQKAARLVLNVAGGVFPGRY